MSGTCKDEAGGLLAASNRRLPAFLVSVAFLMVTALAEQTMVIAAEAGKARPLDRELLKRLGGPPGDELDRELFGPEKESSGKNEPPSRPRGRSEEPSGKSQGDRTRRPSDPTEIGDRQAAASTFAGDDPMVEIARQMRRAESLLAQADTTGRTQEVQTQILRRLDELLRQASRQSSGGSSPSGTKPASNAGKAGQPGQSKPDAKPDPQTPERDVPNRMAGDPKPLKNPRESSSGSGGSKSRDAGGVALMKKLWGNLPMRERQQMLQLPAEGFLPKYQEMTEEYFRRLAEEGKEEPR